jgi:zinc protease
MERLYTMLFNERLSELTKKPDPPFLFGYSSKSQIVRNKDAYILSAGVPDGGIIRGLEALLTESERVRQFGFTGSEMERQKIRLLKSVERIYKERDKSESGTYAAEYIRNFQYDEPVPGIEHEYMLYQKIIPRIQIDEINQLTDNLISDKNRVILLNAPEKPGLTMPDEKELRAVFNSVRKGVIEPYEDIVSDSPLISAHPSPADIIGEKETAVLGIQEILLSNGVRVILKPTDFKNDEIRFSAYSPGGHSLVTDKEHIAASTAASVILESGIGMFNQIELNKLLAGKTVSVSPFVGELYEGISGSAAPKDLETLFQLIYLYFTQPRKDSDAFLSYQKRMQGFIANRNSRPETAFEDTVMTTMAQDHHRRRPWSGELLEEMDLETSFVFYRERFMDASDFTFFFVGNFEPSGIRPLLQRYLGGLPGLNRSETWQDIGITPPKGVINKEVKKGIEPKSRTKIIFHGPFVFNRQNRYDIQSMVRLFQIRLRKKLREELGGTYDVGVWATTTKYPKEEYRLNISFGSAPEKVDELTETVFKEINDFKTYDVTEIEISKVKEMQKRKWETDLKTNHFWLSSLRFYYLYGEDPMNILEYGNYIDKLSSEAIRRSAQQYFDMQNYLKVVLFPGPGIK